MVHGIFVSPRLRWTLRVDCDAIAPLYMKAANDALFRRKRSLLLTVCQGQPWLQTKRLQDKKPWKQYGFQGFLLCMRLKRALMKRVAKIIFYDCFFANCQKNRIWTAGYGDRHERGIESDSKQKGSHAETNFRQGFLLSWIIRWE